MIGGLVTLMVLLMAPSAEAGKLNNYEYWALNKCDTSVHRFQHPFKGMVIASPPREWCRWTLKATQRLDIKAGLTANPDLAKLVRLESGYSPRAQNPSGAFGLGQFMPGTWRGVGCRKTYEPTTQMTCMIKYVKNRYGTPRSAFLYHLRNNSY